jgi:hypothetical protein
MLEPTLKIYGLRAMEFRLKQPAKRAVNLKPIMEVIGYEMLESERELFRTSGASGGHPWSPLKRSTVRRKGGRMRPLIRSGDEEESLSVRGSRYNLFNATRSFILVGSNAPGVPFQINGTSEMVARNPIQFRPDQSESWTQDVADFIFMGEF